jgi:PDZ domain-containing secreted protein
MMKNASVSVCKLILIVLLSVLVFLPYGCAYEQPGETVAEGQRRHKRVLRINHQEMMKDIDKFLLLDQPSKLTGRRIP